MRTHVIFVLAAFIILTSCEKNYDRSLYDEAWKEKDISKAKEYVLQSDIEGEQANGNFLIAYLYKSQQQFDSAIIFYLKALALYELTDNIEWQAHTLKNIGNIHRENSNFKIAKDYYQRGFELNASQYINHEILLKIARTNWRIDEWSVAYEQLKECIEFFTDKSNSYTAEANMIMGNMSFDYGLSSRDKNSFDESFGHYFKAAELYETPYDRARALNNIGNTYLELGRLEKSKTFLDSALQLQTEEKEIALLNHNYGKLYMVIEQFDSALIYFNANISLSKGVTQEAQLSYKKMIDHYIQTGQTELALKMNEAYYIKNQELIEEREHLIKKSKEQEYQLSKNKDVILNQLHKQQNQWLLFVGLITLAILIVVLAIYALLRYRNRITRVRAMLGEY